MSDSTVETMSQAEGAARILTGLNLLTRITEHARDSAFYDKPHDDPQDGGKLDGFLLEAVDFVTEGGKDADETHVSLGGGFTAITPDGENRHVVWHFCIDVKDDADIALEQFGEMIGRLVESGKMDKLVRAMGGLRTGKGGPQSAEAGE